MSSFEFSKDTINQVAKQLVQEYIPHYHNIALMGEMGAGKTTLVSHIIREMGLKSSVTSPTYSIVQEYGEYGDYTLYHMDWHRIEAKEELWEIGIDEYLNDPKAKVFIEWPQIYADELLEDTLYLSLSKIDEDTRRLHISLSPPLDFT